MTAIRFDADWQDGKGIEGEETVSDLRVSPH